MNEESAVTITPVRYCDDTETAITGIEDGNRPVVHKGMSLHKFKQMRFNMGSNNTVGFNNRARLGIHIVPRPAYLRLEPTLQRTEQVGEALAIGMRALYAFEL